MSAKLTLSQVEDFNLRQVQDLCKLVEEIGYRQAPFQLQNNNGSFYSSLGHFFDDNPDAMEAIRDYIIKHANLVDDTDDDASEIEEDES